MIDAVAEHIPAKGAQTIRYYGEYSNKKRGVRNRSATARTHERAAELPGVARRMSWREANFRAWKIDPLLCPICEGNMRIASVIHDPEIIQKILRHLNRWRGPPSQVLVFEASGTSNNKSGEDAVQHMPDYESYPDADAPDEGE